MMATSFWGEEMPYFSNSKRNMIFKSQAKENRPRTTEITDIYTSKVRPRES